jgi:hypothetical protein
MTAPSRKDDPATSPAPPRDSGGRQDQPGWAMATRQRQDSDAPGRRWLRWSWRRRERRIFGCLLWVLTLLIVLLVLSILFGGFQRGTKADGGQIPGTTTAAVHSTS